MARLSRIVVPGLPHHVTQRGNRRQALFAEPGDYALYRDLVAERCRANGVACWAYCLMPNHVHLMLAPADADALPRAVGEAHRRFTAFVNARARTTGHLFQARFASFAMDDAHLLNALRYLAFNPVRAGLAVSPEGGRGRACARISPVATTRWFRSARRWSARRGSPICWNCRSKNRRRSTASTEAVPTAALSARRISSPWSSEAGPNFQPRRRGRKPQGERQG